MTHDLFSVSGDRKNGVTHIKYKRLLQTNEPINDLAIPNNRDVSVIAAIGPLNARKEANAHSHSDVNADDIRIEFNSKVSLDILENAILFWQDDLFDLQIIPLPIFLY